MFQFIKFFLLCCPTRYKSANDFGIALSFPYFECNFLGKSIVEGRGKYDKLLIGWRIVGDSYAMLLEDAADTGSHGDGMARYLEIEVIRKQRVKLNA